MTEIGGVPGGGNVVPVVPYGKLAETLAATDEFISAISGQSTKAGASGVWGENSVGGDGVYGDGTNGVHGKSASASDSGVWGENTGGGYGVAGSTHSTFQPGSGGTAGIWGSNAGSGIGVKGTSAGGDAVAGFSRSTGHAGVSAVNDSAGPSAYGLWAQGTPAGHFEGNLEITGDITRVNTITVQTDVVLVNADCAEHFETTDAKPLEPGTVVVIDQCGTVRPSQAAYDKRVAGVVSGAGNYKPAILLDKRPNSAGSAAVALVGKVCCKADARYAAIEVGDLLTTSSTPGHAMKASDQSKAFGAVIGKALGPLESGEGLIPILIALQ
jgi:hypothetical protein